MADRPAVEGLGGRGHPRSHESLPRQGARPRAELPPRGGRSPYKPDRTRDHGPRDPLGLEDPAGRGDGRSGRRAGFRPRPEGARRPPAGPEEAAIAQGRLADEHRASTTRDEARAPDGGSRTAGESTGSRDRRSVEALIP